MSRQAGRDISAQDLAVFAVCPARSIEPGGARAFSLAVART